MFYKLQVSNASQVISPGYGSITRAVSLGSGDDGTGGSGSDPNADQQGENDGEAEENATASGPAVLSPAVASFVPFLNQTVYDMRLRGVPKVQGTSAR